VAAAPQRLDGAEALDDAVGAEAAHDRDQGVDLVLAEAAGERRLGLRRAARVRERRRAVALGENPDDILYAGPNRVYVSRDGGVFWRGVALELPEIRDVAWV